MADRVREWRCGFASLTRCVTTPRLPLPLALSGAVLVGILTAVQARINGALGVRIDDGIVAAAISFGSGFLVLVALTLVLPRGRAGARRLREGVRARTIPWWMLIGGLAGAYAVATQGLTVGITGVALFTVGTVAGQAVSGLVVDRIGYGPAGIVAVTVPRLLGGAIALAAVGISLTGGDTLERVPLWMLILPFLAGAGIAWQQATNGRLRQRVGSPMTATLVNFAGGTLVLVLAAVVNVAMNGSTEPWPVDPWFYLGGPLGVVYIMMSAALVVHTGVLLLGLGAVVGQLLAALALDALWPAAASPGWIVEVLMVSVALVSVVVATSPWNWRRTARG